MNKIFEDYIARIEEKIEEILSLAKKNNISENAVRKWTDESFNEPKLHSIVWMLRHNIPEDLIEMVVDSNYTYNETLDIIRFYESDEIENQLLYKAVKLNDLQPIVEIENAIDEQRKNFQKQLLSNKLFDTGQVDLLLIKNDTIYVKHEFNWKTYRSKLVLYGNNDKITFYMPQIPLSGAIFSTYVAQKLLIGQMYLQFIFKAVVSSLESLKAEYNISCNIVSCDNCFYAPYLYRNHSDCEKVHMDYLIKEYPKAYEWLQNRKPDEKFYDDFYLKYIPE